MQIGSGEISFYIVVIALLVQFVWMGITKRGRSTYLKDLLNFRKPTTGAARYYGWTVQHQRNTLIDGLAMECVVIGITFIIIALNY
jgi:hypothetical protein